MKLFFIVVVVIVIVVICGIVVVGFVEDLIKVNKCATCYIAMMMKKGLLWVSIVEKYKGDVGVSAKIVMMLKIGGFDYDKVVASDVDLKVVADIVLFLK